MRIRISRATIAGTKPCAKCPRRSYGLRSRAEPLLHPESRRHPGVGVGPADDQDQAMRRRSARTASVRERERAAGRQQERRRDQHRRHLHPPRETVVRRDAGDDRGAIAQIDQSPRRGCGAESACAAQSALIPLLALADVRQLGGIDLCEVRVRLPSAYSGNRAGTGRAARRAPSASSVSRYSLRFQEDRAPSYLPRLRT